jgi:uncharacterized protein (DUF4415 family)
MRGRGKPTKRGARRRASEPGRSGHGRTVRVEPEGVPGLRDRTDFARLDAMTEEDIQRQIDEDPDAPEFTDEMLRSAMWVPAQKKTPISFRVDPDVLEFFKAEGPGYQSRMNAVLRSYMDHRRKRGGVGM